MREARNRRTSKPTAPSDEDPGEQSFAQESREAQADWAYEILFGQGALEKDEATSRVVSALVLLGLADEDVEADASKVKKLRTLVERAINAGVKVGRIDKPKPGQVRAIRTDPREYTLEDWQLCLVSALDDQPTERDAALRFAAYWAASNTGLAFARLQRGGAILTGLEAALDRSITKGRFVDVGDGCIRKALWVLPEAKPE